MTDDLEIRVHVAALYVALVKAGELDAATSLLEWAQEELELDTELLEEEYSPDA
ncbi:MAG TPA: hypothetical protein VNH14_14530 [Gemmatimonadales bacterium]|nr:hypothetical protein [Gemmatimonadales bacterium]